MADRLRVGFMGLGYMGQPMVTRLLDAGHAVTVHNRNRDKCAPFAARGATVAASPRELAAGSDVVVSMLATSAAVEATVAGDDGVLAGARPGLTLIDMGSTAPQVSTALAATCATRGVAMLDAPVAGTVRAATDGTLVVMVGGDESAYAAQAGLLSTFGKHVFYLGPSGSGARMKLVVNILLSLTSQALAESLVFGAAQGLDRQKMLDVLVTTPSSSGVVQRKGQAMVNRDFKPAAPLRLLYKDLGQALSVAQELEIPLPATATAHALYATGMARGLAEQDFAAIHAVMEHLAGLDTRKNP
ncbi:MAG: NAD(P)-dependent oxidoreductase [Betaproteobacteria bacterium]|nr:NAD(P)-dependent oxidoreductase [Betaproteobacteria bacterium]